MYQVLYVSTYERRYVQLHSVEQRQYSSSIYQVEDNSESLWYYYRSGTTIAAYIYMLQHLPSHTNNSNSYQLL